jgi:hypothetical protein
VRFHRFVDGVGVPNAVFERAAAIVNRLRRSARDLVLESLNAIDDAGWQLAHERAPESMLLDQVARDMSELSGKVFVNEQNVHGSVS